MVLNRVNTALMLLVFATMPACAQFSTTLQPQTVRDFDAYAKKVEQELDLRWSRSRPLFVLDEDRQLKARVLKGEVPVRSAIADNPAAISNGLVHDWIGDIFVPGVQVQQVLAVLQNFDTHAQIYPDMKFSRLLTKDGNDVVGMWRIEKNAVVTIALDVTDETHYRQIAPGTWTCRAYAKNIQEVENPDTPQESKKPVGQGNGFLWRLYAYWTIQATNGGVLIESRTLSLSRDVPAAIGWAVNPYIRKQPKESLRSTLEGTRKALAH